MSKWAEVALVSEARGGDEPFDAWILCNTERWAVSGKQIRHCVTDFKT